MFQSLRPNSSVYILHKDTAILETGSVVSVSNPVPKYQVPQMFGTPQEMVVDLVVKINNQDVTYQKLPATLDIADFGSGNIVLTDNREAMNSEILGLKQKSASILDSIEFHKDVITKCEALLSLIAVVASQRTQDLIEINALKLQVNEMTKNIADLIALNKKLVSQNASRD